MKPSFFSISEKTDRSLPHKKKSVKAALVRRFYRLIMAGAIRFEPSARGFGGGYPCCLELTYLRRVSAYGSWKYDVFTTYLHLYH
jgi:hypothetical protein